MIPLDGLGFLTSKCTEALSAITDNDIERLTPAILTGKRIFVFGVGRSGLIGQTFAIRLVQMGLQVYFVGDMTTPIIGKDDVLLVISNTGKTMSAVKTAEIAQRLGTRVISVTSEKESKLAKYSDLVIPVCPTEGGEEAPLGTLFEDATLLFFDTVVPVLMRKLDVTEKDMRNNHAIWV